MTKKNVFLYFSLAAILTAFVAGGCSKPQTAAGGTAGGAQGAFDSILRTTADWPTYTDPAVGNDQSDTLTMTQLYDPLFYPNIKGEPEPHIATEWSASPDGLTYTFKIREGVKFHSGNILTAEDVVYSMKRLLTIGEGGAYLFKGVVKDVSAPDASTVVFTLDHTFGPFVSSLIRFGIVDKKLLEQHYDTSTKTYGEFGDYGKTWLLTNDAGSGPYKAIDIKLEEYVLAEKFDDYFKGWDPNAPKYFQISGAVEPVYVRTAMANRELEITDNTQPVENYDSMAQIPGVTVVAYDSAQTLNLCINTKKSPTDDVHFRRALAYAFDYETVITDIYPGSLLIDGPVPANLPGANPNLKPYRYDLAKAKAELAQSKYKGETIELVWCAEASFEEKIAMLMMANFTELGIKVDVIRQPFGSMIESSQSVESTPHLSIVLTAPAYFEAGAILYTRYHSSSAGTWEQMEWLQDKAIDAAIEDALATIDMETRFAKYRAIQETIIDICPSFWIFDMVERRAYQSDYVEWPLAEYWKAGTPFVYPIGFNINAHDTKVFPEKRK
jgi:peptide/nickel transport system substrate-binding protein